MKVIKGVQFHTFVYFHGTSSLHAIQQRKRKFEVSTKIGHETKCPPWKNIANIFVFVSFECT